MNKLNLQIPFVEGGILNSPIFHSTDDYVKETNLIYAVESQKVHFIGHPFKPIMDSQVTTKINVPFVSPHRYTVVEMNLPDPNKFSFPKPSGLSLKTEKYVWKVVGFRVDAGESIAPSFSGNYKMNYTKGQPTHTAEDMEEQHSDSDSDMENDIFHRHPKVRETTQTMVDSRTTVCWNAPITQILGIGAAPLRGTHWTNTPATQFPPNLGEITSDIVDGDICDIGFGNINYASLIQDKATLPIEAVLNPTLVSKKPDEIAMKQSPSGNECFMLLYRKQLLTKLVDFAAGIDGEKTTVSGKFADNQFMPAGPIIPDGGQYSNTGDIFGKNFWLMKSEGPNNGICWRNKLYITMVDSLRGHILTAFKDTSSSTQTWDSSHFTFYMRHMKTYHIQAIVKLCKITLEAELTQYLEQMNEGILNDWGFNFNFSGKLSAGGNGTVNALEPVKTVPEITENADEDKPYPFIIVDCEGKLTPHLHTTPLGRSYNNYFNVAPPKPAAKRARK